MPQELLDVDIVGKGLATIRATFNIPPPTEFDLAHGALPDVQAITPETIKGAMSDAGVDPDAPGVSDEVDEIVHAIDVVTNRMGSTGQRRSDRPYRHFAMTSHTFDRDPHPNPYFFHIVVGFWLSVWGIGIGYAARRGRRAVSGRPIPTPIPTGSSVGGRTDFCGNGPATGRQRRSHLGF